MTEAPAPKSRPRRGAPRTVLAKLRRQAPAAFGASVVLATLSLACSLGPWLLAAISGDSIAQQHLGLGAQPPSWRHLFGTDAYGRDVLVRVLAGGQISLLTGLFGASVAAVLGTLYGAIAGFAGGRLDNLMMRLVDIIDALPYMFLVIVLATLFGKSLVLLFVALGLVGWLLTARIVRAQMLALKEREFVLAARALGASRWRLIGRHLLPNTLGPIIVSFTLSVPSMVMQEAFLSFLGLGVQAPRPSLGSLISEGATSASLFWWQLAFPALFLAVLLLCVNLIGDALRDLTDPTAPLRDEG